MRLPKIRSTKNGFFVIVIFFILSRIFYYLIGIRFDITPLYWFYQFIDPQLLKLKLLESILYLHTQPPVFNLFLGLILKIFNKYELFAFTAIYQIIGLLLAVNLYLVLKKLRVSLIIALLITMFFTISPPVIFMENWLFYTYPVALLILLSTVFLYLYLEKHMVKYLLLFFSSIALIVLTRSLFHPFWFIIILVGLIIYDKSNIKRIILCALFPMLLIGVFHIKNYLIFKQTNLSSWFGMNLAKMTMTIPLEKIEPLVVQGEISGIAKIMPFQEPERYRNYANFDTLTCIRVLDQKYKSSGFLNFNHIGYIDVSNHYLRDSKYLIKTFPQYYGLSICKAVYAYLRPCSDSIIIRNYNRWAIRTWVDFYENYLLGNILSKVWQTSFTNRYGEQRKVHLNFLYIFVPALCIWGMIIAVKGFPLFRYGRVEILTIGYILFNIIYITVIGNLFEVSENMRFRFLIVPFLYVFLAIWLKHLFNRYEQT